MKKFKEMSVFAILLGFFFAITACSGTTGGSGDISDIGRKIVVSEKSDPVLLGYVTKINSAAPLKPKAEPSADSAMLKRMGLWGMSLQGVSLNETTMIFNFQLADTLGEERRSSLIMMSPFVQMMVVQGAKNYFGEEGNPFKTEFLKAVQSTKIRWFLRFVGTDDLYADVVVVKSGLPVPYEETPNDKVTMVDGYPTVKIGEQVWMAENLNIETSGSMCYDNDPEKCKKGGRLYTIEDARNVCPAGWHLPDTSELNALLETVGDAKKLLSANYDEWSKTYAGTDDFGFRLRPAGQFDGENFEFGHIGTEGSGTWMCFNCVHAYLWTSTFPLRKTDDWNHRILGYYAEFPSSSLDEKEANRVRLFTARDSLEEKTAFSVRCLKGEPVPQKDPYAPTAFMDSRDSMNYKQIVVDGKTWMAENLRFKTDSSFCYNDDESMCQKYGRLYTWASAKEACPVGWHLPSEEEWNGLRKFVNWRPASLRSKTEWGVPGQDDYNFNVLPAGHRNSNSSAEPAVFEGQGTLASFWTSSEKPSWFRKEELEPIYFYFVVNDYHGDMIESTTRGEAFHPAYSVRCVKSGN